MSTYRDKEFLYWILIVTIHFTFQVWVPFVTWEPRLAPPPPCFPTTNACTTISNQHWEKTSLRRQWNIRRVCSPLMQAANMIRYVINMAPVQRKRRGEVFSGLSHQEWCQNRAHHTVRHWAVTPTFILNRSYKFFGYWNNIWWWVLGFLYIGTIFDLGI